uniref:Uncharacterized protein n=1 Tax=Eutreptiella gymnastica TaxID=73025 RepID=A0A7S4GIS3_9EUGL
MHLFQDPYHLTEENMLVQCHGQHPCPSEGASQSSHTLRQRHLVPPFTWIPLRRSYALMHRRAHAKSTKPRIPSPQGFFVGLYVVHGSCATGMVQWSGCYHHKYHRSEKYIQKAMVCGGIRTWLELACSTYGVPTGQHTP